MVEPALHGSPEGPHPAVITAGVAPDDPRLERARRRRAAHLEGRADGLLVGLPLNPRAPVGEEERQEDEEVDEPHPEAGHPAPLPEVHALVAEENVALEIVHPLPCVGHVQPPEHRRVIAGEVDALAAAGDDREEHGDGALEAGVPLLPDLEPGKLVSDLGEQLLVAHRFDSPSRASPLQSRRGGARRAMLPPLRLLASALFWRILLSSLAVVGVLGYGLFRATAEHKDLEQKFERLVKHDLKLADDAEVLLRVMGDLETGKQGFLLTGDRVFLQRYKDARDDQLDATLKEAKEAADEPREEDHVRDYRRLVHEWIDTFADRQIVARERGEVHIPIEGEDKKLKEMRDVLEELRNNAVADANKRQDEALGSVTSLGQLTTGIFAFAIILGIGTGIWIARDLAGAAGQLEQALAATGRLEPLPPLPQRRDELGSVGVSLVKMAHLLQEKDSSLRATLAERERAVRDLTIANETLARRDANARTYAEFVRELKTLDVHALASAGLRSLVKLADAQIGVVYLLDGANRLVPVYATALDGRAMDQNLFGTEGLPKTTMGRREPIVLDGHELGRVPPKISLGVATATIDWILAHPIAVENEEAGAIVLAGVIPPSSEQQELVRDAARQLAVGLHNAWTHDRLREKSVMLAEQGETLARANKVKTEFLASMSHELRTPLSAIIGFADLLTSSPREQLSPRARESLERIKRNGEHLLALINDVLDLAKAESGHAEIRLAPTNMPQLCRACVAEVESLREGKDVKLTVDVPDAAIETMTDPQRVRQILLNLLSNALKFTESGEVSVSLRPAATELRIAVKDTGIGIPQASLPELFQEFHQLEKGDGRRYEGTGIGLALSRRLARALGGDIEVRSREKEGSTFTLILPRVTPPPVETGRMSQPPSSINLDAGPVSAPRP